MKRRLAMVPTLAALLALVLAALPASALEEADRLYTVGERALEDRFFPVARRALERFVAQFPRDPRLPRALLLLGQARLRVDDAQSALEAVTRAQPGLSAPADQLEAKFWEAEALFRLKRLSEARAAYDHVVRTDAASPRAPEALYGFAWSELELQRPEPAVTALREFLRTWPDNARAANATLQLARALVELKRVDEALPLLTSFATKYPGSKLAPDAQFLAGWVKFNNSDRSGGFADLQAFVAAHPNHEKAGEARLLLAQAAAKYGDRAQMEQAYTMFMAQDPPTADGLHQAATIATRLARPKDVESAWTKLKTHFPEHALTSQLALERARAAFDQKNWKDTVALGRIAAQSDDNAVKAEAWLLVGESELPLKNFAQAAKAFEAVGAMSDVDAGDRYRALAGLGLAREAQKEWKAALTAYEAVASRSPDTTLRTWARQRAAAVKAQLPKSGNGAPPPKRSEPSKPDKPTGKKS